MFKRLNVFRKAKLPILEPRHLADVRAGTRVRISGFTKKLGLETLLDRGIHENAEVTVLAQGDPLLCLVLGSRIMLNKSTAKSIAIEVIS